MKILNKQYKKLFELDGVELEIEEDALKAIAHKAVERNTGARGLRSIIENVMMDSMFNIPSDKTVRKCIITKDAVEGKAEPTVVFAKIDKSGTERDGCVPVDARLAELLQLLLDKYTFENVTNSWLKVCYYYDYLGPAK